MHKAVLLQKVNRDLELQVGKLPLAEKAGDIVPGEGSAEARLVFVGEAPGAQEQLQRRPFVGRSGQLLRSILTEVGLPPETVYITSIVKARPPENRDPTSAEISAYAPYLDREIAIISPALVVTLGRFSMAHFLPGLKISQAHGKLHEVPWGARVLRIFPMYHPAAALRSTRTKAAFIQDFQKIPASIR
jgi:uracil-DNA glycosylase family 4